jgi:hypothetical protein
VITIFSSVEDSIAFDSRRQMRSIIPALIAGGRKLRVLIHALSCRMERHFAAFAGVPYQDPASREQWEQLWESELASNEVEIPTNVEMDRIYGS